jgi:Poly A polymerase head domain/Probable RNA and SrmB- binding site of polymerase A
MSDLLDQLIRARILPCLPNCLATGESCYLVGGALRDFFLKRPSNDFDFAMPGDPTPLARRFASRIGGSWFMLDRTRLQSRVVLKTNQNSIIYDFAPFRGASLNEDLFLRDFTVNALALNLCDPTGPLADPLASQDDLNKALLRACSPDVFQNDPLRVLRGVRLSATLAMTIEAETFVWMKNAVSALSAVAAERVTHELNLIFSVDSPAAALEKLEQLGVFPLVFGLPGAGGTYAQGIQRVQQLSDRLQIYGTELSPSLQAETVPASAILRLAAFMAGSCIDPLRLKRLRFSRRNTALIRSLVNLTHPLADELLARNILGRGRALLIGSLGPDPGLCLLYLLGLSSHPVLMQEWIREAMVDYSSHVRHGRIPDLVAGSWIRERLEIEDGAVIGHCLRRLRLEEIAGRVQSPDDAHKFLKSLAIKNIDKNADPP